MINSFPLIKFTLGFVIGIVASSIINLNIIIPLTVIVLFLIIFYVAHKFNSSIFQTSNYVIIYLIILCFGFIYYRYDVNKTQYYPFKYPKYKNALVHGKIDKINLLREGRLSFYLNTDSIIVNSDKYFGAYNLLCSIYDEKSKVSRLYHELSVGNEVLFESYLQRPRNKRNPFEFDYEKYLNDRDIAALTNSYSVSTIKVTSKQIDFVGNSIFGIRKYLDEKITSLHNSTTSSMLRGLILADRSGIDYQINQDFINSGVVHVLSVSGLHVGYIVIIFLFLFSRMNLYWRILLTVIGLFIYMIITGSEAPVFRSTIMATIILCVPLLGRETSGLNSLSFAALILLLINPRELFNPSFQLSFSAILTLILLFPIIKRNLDKVKISSPSVKMVLLFFGSTLAAQIGTLPFTLFYFGRLSITSLIANAFVIPISGIIVGLGILSLFIITFSTWLAGTYAACNEFLTYWMLQLVRLFGNPNYSIVTVNQFSLYDSIIFYLSLGLLISVWKYLSSLKSKITFILLLLATYYTLFRIDNYELLPDQKLSVMMIDVGQGDAFLLKFPNGKIGLIDAGSASKKFDNGKRIIEPLLDKLGIDKIDYAFVSHVDDDHYKGFISLIEDDKIDLIYKTVLDTSEIKDLRFENYLKRKRINTRYFTKGKIVIGNSALYFILNPADKENKNTNDRSGIIKLVYGNNSMLFTGDASIRAEKELTSKYSSFLKSDILKLGHHGSKSSSSEAFLDEIRPKITLASSGIMNKFKHPSSDVIKRLKSRNINILRSDRLGAVILQSDGESIKLIDWRKIQSSFINL